LGSIPVAGSGESVLKKASSPMKNSGKFLRLDFAAASWQSRSYSPTPRKIVQRIDLSPRIELSLAVDVEADPEIPEPTEN